MTERFILLAAGVLAMTSACSGAGTTAPAYTDGVDAEAEAAAVASDDGTDGGDPPDADPSPSIDASTRRDSGTTTGPRDAGTVQVHDAGLVQVYCNQAGVGVCQSSSVSPDKEASYRAMCQSAQGSATACPASGLVGCCVRNSGHYCFYSIDYTPATAQASCSMMNGTWSTSL